MVKRSRVGLGCLAAGLWGLAGQVASQAIVQVAGQEAVHAQQVIPDGSLGDNASEVFPVGTTDLVLGGLQSDRNLFHSFEAFGIAPGRAATFVVEDRAIENILSRVTGGRRTEIFGLLETVGFFEGRLIPADVNLFLINPNGILFGPGSRLNIGTANRGSFVATTADRLLWGNGDRFDASPTQPPTALLSIAGNPVQLAAADNIASLAPIQLRDAFLGVSPGQNLLLIGGDISSQNSVFSLLSNQSGKLVLGGLAAGQALDLGLDLGLIDGDATAPDLSAAQGQSLSGGTLSLEETIIRGATFQDGASIVLSADAIRLTNSEIDLTSLGETGDSGEITLNARVIQLTDSAIETSAIAGGTAGEIRLRLGEQLRLDRSLVRSQVRLDGRGRSRGISLDGGAVEMDASQIVSTNQGVGDAGPVQIRSRSLDLRNAAQILSLVNDGNAGEITIEAEMVQLAGGQVTPGGWSASLIASRLSSPTVTPINITLPNGETVLGLLGSGSGRSGNVRVTAQALSLSDGAAISTSTEGLGNGGNLWIDADQIRLAGVAADGSVPTILTASVSRGGVGDGGAVTIRADQLLLQGGAQIGASVFGFGAGGTVEITADRLQVEGTSPFLSASASGIYSQLQASSRDALAVSEGREALAANAIGQTGAIAIFANQVQLLGGGQIGSNIALGGIGIAAGGTLTIQADSIEVSGQSEDGAVPSSIGSQVLFGGQGTGGNVVLDGNSLRVADGGLISVQNLIQGAGGNLTIRAQSLGQDRGELSAETTSGQGGNINLQVTQGIFMGNDSLISTTAGNSQNPGDGGNIAIAPPSSSACPRKTTTSSPMPSRAPAATSRSKQMPFSTSSCKTSLASSACAATAPTTSAPAPSSASTASLT
ncbi:MAG: filamentous hemagglutinin N-terminal domain-containing protein [Synechococcales cyanobacterium RM1_1_8]|nr:filamentous hemagglutinin N-terminal domain-containing protein [Synechococcales cyanobacterium RM1_1_8]